MIAVTEKKHQKFDYLELRTAFTAVELKDITVFWSKF